MRVASLQGPLEIGFDYRRHGEMLRFLEANRLEHRLAASEEQVLTGTSREGEAVLSA